MLVIFGWLVVHWLDLDQGSAGIDLTTNQHEEPPDGASDGSLNLIGGLVGFQFDDDVTSSNFVPDCDQIIGQF